jgi:hypothetical protein
VRDRRVGAKLDDELHAHRPLADLVAFGHSQAAIDVATHRADRPISDDRQRSVNIHSRSEAGFRIALFVHALIEQTHAQNFLVLRSAPSLAGIPGQICTVPLDSNCEPTH